MIKREMYLKKIRDSYDSELIKVIIGVRRSGKSVLMKQIIDELKEKGVWVYGADMDGTDYDECDFSGACAIVIGNEGKGISRLVREKCDVIASLPMKGQINSLNASVAAGILMYKAMKNR